MTLAQQDIKEKEIDQDLPRKIQRKEKKNKMEIEHVMKEDVEVKTSEEEKLIESITNDGPTIKEYDLNARKALTLQTSTSAVISHLVKGRELLNLVNRSNVTFAQRRQ